MSVNSKMTAIADKIRAIRGTTGKVGLDAMATNLGTVQTDITSAFTAIGNKDGTVPSSKVSGNLATAINSIPVGVDTSDANATENDILNGKTAYVDGTKVTGKIATKTASDVTASGSTVTTPAGYYSSAVSKSVSTATQATPSISVSTAGVITASATQTAGYVPAGTKTATKNLTTQAAQTITPGTSDKTIASGRYLTGTQTIKGDSNLVAGNIKQGVSIFGVSGSFEGNAPQVFTGSVTGQGTSFDEEINCGFQPDLVIVKAPYTYNEYGGYINNDMCVWLSDSAVGSAHCTQCHYGVMNGTEFPSTFGCYITKTENGFSLGSFIEISFTGEFRYSTETVIYTAIKF